MIGLVELRVMFTYSSLFEVKHKHAIAATAVETQHNTV